MKQNSVSKPLSFTVLEVNDEPMISGGLISDASRFEDDDELMELAMQSCDDPVFHVFLRKVAIISLPGNYSTFVPLCEEGNRD